MKLTSKMAARVQGAVVRLPRLGGQGVLVYGGFVLTAAHCIGWTSEGYMALEADDFREQILTTDGRTLTVSLCAMDPISDFAVLRAVDHQRSPDLAMAFGAFCDATRPVPLSLGVLPLQVERDVFVFTHNKGIVSARAAVWCEDAPIFTYEADEGIDGGTSGGPVVTGDGKLLGVVSTAGGPRGEPACEGQATRLLFAAPVWVVNRLRKGGKR